MEEGEEAKAAATAEEEEEDHEEVVDVGARREVEGVVKWELGEAPLGAGSGGHTDGWGFSAVAPWIWG